MTNKIFKTTFDLILKVFVEIIFFIIILIRVIYQTIIAFIISLWNFAIIFKTELQPRITKLHNKVMLRYKGELKND